MDPHPGLFGALAKLVTTARCAAADTDVACVLEEAARDLTESAASRLHLSTRTLDSQGESA